MSDDEHYGIGPCIIYDLPTLRADNERKRRANIQREHEIGWLDGIEFGVIRLKPGTVMTLTLPDDMRE